MSSVNAQFKSTLGVTELLNLSVYLTYFQPKKTADISIYLKILQKGRSMGVGLGVVSLFTGSRE